MPRNLNFIAPPHNGHHEHELTTREPTTTPYTTTTTPTTSTTSSWHSTTHWQTTTSSTTGSPSTTQSVTTETEQSCEHGVYYPHKDCHNFYVCVNGELVSQMCGPSLVWNVDQNRCDWKFITQCGDRYYRQKTRDNLIQREYISRRLWERLLLIPLICVI